MEAMKNINLNKKNEIIIKINYKYTTCPNRTGEDIKYIFFFQFTTQTQKDNCPLSSDGRAHDS